MHAKSAAPLTHANQPDRLPLDEPREGRARGPRSGVCSLQSSGKSWRALGAWRTLALAAASTFGAVACAEGGGVTAEPVDRAEWAIEGGRIATDATEVVRVDYISAMVSQPVSCSGVIIAPNLVLTARHCVSPRLNDLACDGVSSFGPVTTSPMAIRLQTPSGALVEVRVDPPARVVVDEREQGCGPDLALISVPALAKYRDESWFWVASPRLDRPVELGEVYSAIGFGSQSPREDSSGERRERQNLDVDCVGGGCNTPGISDHEWKGKVGVCGGDSGGPALDDRGRIIGIVSRGNPDDCNGPIYTSVYAWRDWLLTEALAAADSGGYPAPPWTTRVAAASEQSDGEGEAEGGCSLGFSPAPSRGAPWLAALALATLLGARRRRSPTRQG